MSDKLRITLTRQEQEDCYAVAFVFSVHNGMAYITEEWDSNDELYAAGVTIKMPERVWAEGSAWLSNKLRECVPSGSREPDNVNTGGT